jgi:integrase/recombinase XerD
LTHLLPGYQLCARAEGKTPATVTMVTNSVNYLVQYLESTGASTDAALITPTDIRSYILYLQAKPRFTSHPYSRQQDTSLSDHTVHAYLRSIRAFWSWLVREGIVPTSPFTMVRMPRLSHKVMPTLTPDEVRALLKAIDVSLPVGYRNYTIVATLVDTGLRLSELINITVDDIWFQEGMVRVMGKGRKERLVPFGREVQHCLWRYYHLLRPSPLAVSGDRFFLTDEGAPMTKGRIQAILKIAARRAGLGGRKISPHVMRHTAATSFLRNKGNAFALQRMLGHTTLEMTRKYCELADVDVKTAHLTASPVDNLGVSRPSVKNPARNGRVTARQAMMGRGR